jgi:hypothetical protein
MLARGIFFAYRQGLGWRLPAAADGKLSIFVTASLSRAAAPKADLRPQETDRMVDLLCVTRRRGR